jgi:site-specific DNA-methyltransferase (adenine-specific)
MDPFLGLGSTAVACARLGVDFVGVEIDEHYLEEAIQRVQTLPPEPRRLNLEP